MLDASLGIPVGFFLGLGFVWSLSQAFQRIPSIQRVNHVFHALMALGMIEMAWHWLQVPPLLQILVFAAVSFWFLVQAAAHPSLNLSCRTGRDRAVCAYHSVTMAAMVLMLVMMIPSSSHHIVMTAMAPHRHHQSANIESPAVTASLPSADPTVLGAAALLFSVAFAIAALFWAVSLASGVRASDENVRTARCGTRLRVTTVRAHETVSALAMALMFGALAL